jgi:hypothetical protein
MRKAVQESLVRALALEDAEEAVPGLAPGDEEQPVRYVKCLKADWMPARRWPGQAALSCRSVSCTQTHHSSG